MTYAINGKEWTEFDINKRCAELMGFKGNLKYLMDSVFIPTTLGNCTRYDPCNNPIDTDAIIDMCWNDLTVDSPPVEYENLLIHWEYLMKKHNCTKLVAACICYIEINSI
jgi:hypothetical protein